MKKRSFLFLFLLLCLLMTACGQSDKGNVKHIKKVTELFEEPQEIVIDCFGDSITWGQFNSEELERQIQNGEIYPSLDDGGQLFEDYGIYISSVYQSDPTYPQSLQTNLNQKLKEAGYGASVRTVNDGISGDWLTKDSFRRISCDPDITVVLFCGNNFYFNQPYKGTLEKNIDALQRAGSIVYLLTYPLYPNRVHTDDFASANQYIREVAKKKNVRLIDTYQMFEEAIELSYDRQALFSQDCIHLSPLGYDLLGQFVAEGIFADLDQD